MASKKARPTAKSMTATELLAAKRKCPVIRRASVLVDGAEVVFTFRSIGRGPFNRLQDEHPPTSSQQTRALAEARALGLPDRLARLRWDADTFPPALVAAAAMDPVISSDEAAAMFDDDGWNEAELTALFAAAVAAQTERDLPAGG